MRRSIARRCYSITVYRGRFKREDGRDGREITIREMRKGCVTAIVVTLLLIGAVTLVFALGYFASPRTVDLETDTALVALIARADSSRVIIAVPSFGPLFRVVDGHPLTERVVAQRSDRGRIQLLALLAGNNPVVIALAKDDPQFITRAGTIRRFVLATVASFAGLNHTSDGSLLVLGNTSLPERPATVPAQRISAGLRGEAFLVQHEGKDRFPPVGRPSVTAVSVRGDEIALLARGRIGQSAMLSSSAGAFEAPRDAMFSIVFWQPHDALEDLDRFLPLNLHDLARRGTMLSIYDVEGGRLLPRPRGLIVVPETQESTEAVGALFNTAAFRELGDTPVTSREVGGVKIDRARRLGAEIEVARVGGKLLIGLDGTSIEKYLSAQRFTLSSGGAIAWSAVASASRLRPVLDDLKDEKSLKFLAPRMHRSVRQMASFVQLLPPEAEVTANKRVTPSAEEVEVILKTK